MQKVKSTGSPDEPLTRLTPRQARELEYHRLHAEKHRDRAKGVALDVIHSSARRWWNPYWDFYSHLMAESVAGKDVLVVGCGFGEDVARIGKLGAKISAFDLSPESVQIARELVRNMGVEANIQTAPAESMPYPDRSFDVLVVFDILHHVDIPATMREVARVARPAARFLSSDPYTFSTLERLRRSRLVDRLIYPALRRVIYASADPYITDDERKCDEQDVQCVCSHLVEPRVQYHNAVVRRVLPQWDWAAKADRKLLDAIGGAGALLGGRVSIFGDIKIEAHPVRAEP